MANLALTRGDTNVLRVTVTREDDSGFVSPVNLAGCLMWFTAKRDPKDADEDALIRKGTPDTGLDGITYVDSLLGIADVTVFPEETESMSSSVTYLYYDAQIKELDDRITTVAQGRLTIGYDITQAAS